MAQSVDKRANEPANERQDSDLKELEALLASAQRSAAEDITYWHALNDVIEASSRLLAEVRAARAVIEEVHEHRYNSSLECPCCYAHGETGHRVAHHMDCPLAAYDALSLQQAKDYS